jgi:hypothetical protein
MVFGNGIFLRGIWRQECFWYRKREGGFPILMAENLTCTDPRFSPPTASYTLRFSRSFENPPKRSRTIVPGNVGVRADEWEFLVGEVSPHRVHRVFAKTSRIEQRLIHLPHVGILKSAIQ